MNGKDRRRVLITSVPFGQADPASLEVLKTAGADYVLNPLGRRPTEEELAEMARDLADCASPVVEAGTVILGKIRDRAYTEYAKFRTDLTAYLDRINERNAALENAFEANRTWREAALWLKEDYWRDFLFDPDSELAGYLA